MIESNTALASSIASGIANGASSISGVSAAKPDGNSSYYGNNDAALHIGREASYSDQVAAKFSEFVGLVQSIASEFEAVDQELGSSMFQNVIASSTSPQLPRQGLPNTGAYDRLLVD